MDHVDVSGRAYDYYVHIMFFLFKKKISANDASLGRDINTASGTEITYCAFK